MGALPTLSWRSVLGLGLVVAFLFTRSSTAFPDEDGGKPVTVRGELKRVCQFDDKGGSVEKWFLVGAVEKEGGGAGETQTYTAVFEKDKPDLPTGAHITAKGKLNGSTLSVSSGRDEESVTVNSQPATASVGGSISVTAIIVNFPGYTQGCTPGDVTWMLNSAPNCLAQYYPAASNGRFSVSATCKGPVTVPYSSDTWAVAAAADQAANVSSGYRMYILPDIGWGWAGLGELGGKRTWINTLTGWMLVYTHEIGHNLGMHHAGSGWGGEYGDHSCTMGNPGVPPLLNGPHKVQMGWATATSISTNGTYTYTLTNLESATGTQVLKLPKTDTGESYYVSFRAPIGLDASNLGSGYHYTTAVHHWYGGMGVTWMDTLLGDGQTFSDGNNGVTITQLSHDGVSSTVQVVLQANARPVASITPSNSRGKAPLTITFNGGASYDPDGVIVGWTWYLPDGTTVTGTNQVTHTFTTSGTYSLTLIVTDDRGLTGSATAKVRVR